MLCYAFHFISDLPSVHIMSRSCMLLLVFLTPTTFCANLHPNETLRFQIDIPEKNATPFKLLVDEVEHEMIHNMLTLTGTQDLIFQAVMAANFLAGTLYRCLLFKQVWQDGRFNKPINIMTGIFVCPDSVIL